MLQPARAAATFLTTSRGPPPASRRYQGSADAVRKNLGELRDEARGVTPARDYIILSGSGEAAALPALPRSRANLLAALPGLHMLPSWHSCAARTRQHCECGSIALVSPCQPGFGVWLSPEAFRQQAHAARVQPRVFCPLSLGQRHSRPCSCPAKAAPLSLRWI